MNHNPPSIVLFLVSPSFGLLDNWLPVFCELKKRRPDITLTALFPKTETVSEINSAEIITQLGESIFNKVIFKSRAGFWVMADSLAHARELSGRFRTVNLIIRKVRTALRLSGRYAVPRPLIALVDMFLERIVVVLTKEKHTALGRISANVKAICFDVYAKTKKECQVVLEHFPNTPRFSIQHGLAMADFELKKKGDYDIAYRTYAIMAYLYSEREAAAYKNNYGLKNSEMKIVGVPRHDPDWIRTVLRGTTNDIPPSWNTYIFVISRPVVEGFFPREKKRKALEDIRKLAFEDLHVKVVVRFHPTERRVREGLYEEVFGKELYGKQWMYSSSHPSVIGEGSLFAISFYSGVAIDMLAVGRPTIQISRFIRGEKTGAIVDYKKMGLVLGADNYEELKDQAHRILEHKESVLNELIPHYRESFAPVGKPIRTIADDISKVL